MNQAACLVPGGPEKGKPIQEASEKTLVYWVDRIAKTLGSGESRFPQKDERWLAAARAELANRGVDTAQSAAAATKPAAAKPAAPTNNGRPAASTALAKTEPTQIVGSTRDVGRLNQQLRDYSQSMHLVSPATVCGHLPEGWEVAISIVHVDPNTAKDGPGEVYPTGGGKVGLSGPAIKRIGGAAGVSWDMERSGRLDDGSDPHYCHYRSVGRVRNFDGSWRCISGEVELDMRDGSPQIDAMRERSKSTDGFESQLRDTRLFLLRHAETKAKLRAICDMGVKRSYTQAELHKPFAVAQLMWTGRSDDPELRREFARMGAQAAMDGMRALYGRSEMPTLPEPRQVQAAPPVAGAPPQFVGHAPPPISTVPADDYEEVDYAPADPSQADTASAQPPTNGNGHSQGQQDLPGTDVGKL